MGRRLMISPVGMTNSLHLKVELQSLGCAPNEQTAPGCSAAFNLQSRRDDLKVAQDAVLGKQG